jgi:hypothetical protein
MVGNGNESEYLQYGTVATRTEELEETLLEAASFSIYAAIMLCIDFITRPKIWE